MSNVAEKTIYALGWKSDDLQRLNDEGQRLIVETSSLEDIKDTLKNIQKINYQRLSTVRKQLHSFVQSLSKDTRNPASHIFVS